MVAQTVLPALMFVPRLLPYRTPTRLLAFLLPLAAWATHAVSGPRAAGGRPFPPAVPLAMCRGGWWGLSLANPWINTLSSAVCAVTITIAVFIPAFWAPAVIVDSRQLRRLLMLMLICNGASALMGVAQVYRPDTFRPPKIVLFETDPDLEAGSSFVRDDGTRVLRPPGLSDTPGGAAIGGLTCTHSAWRWH